MRPVCILYMCFYFRTILPVFLLENHLTWVSTGEPSYMFFNLRTILHVFLLENHLTRVSSREPSHHGFYWRTILPGFLLQNHITRVSTREPSNQGFYYRTILPGFQQENNLTRGSNKEPSYQGSSREPFNHFTGVSTREPSCISPYPGLGTTLPFTSSKPFLDIKEYYKKTNIHNTTMFSMLKSHTLFSSTSCVIYPPPLNISFL